MYDVPWRLNYENNLAQCIVFSAFRTNKETLIIAPAIKCCQEDMPDKGWIARKRKEAMPEHRRLTMTKHPALWTSRFWQYLVAGVINEVSAGKLRDSRINQWFPGSS